MKFFKRKILTSKLSKLVLKNSPSSKNAVESVLDYLHGNSLEVNVDDKERKKLYIAARYLDVQNIIDDLKIVCEANELTLDEPKLTKISKKFNPPIFLNKKVSSVDDLP